MSSEKHLAPLYLAALTPLSVTALVWSISGLPSESVNFGLIVAAIILTAGAARVRIMLPKTDLPLALSEAVVLFSLLAFGGELAVVLSTAAAIASLSCRDIRTALIDSLTKVCVSITTVFVTAVGLLTFVGEPDDVLEMLGGRSFLVVIGFITLLPFVLNTILISANLAIRRESRYICELWSRTPEAWFVYAGSALMAGLGLMAFKNTDLFLFFCLSGFFVILQIVLRRYRTDYNESRKQVEHSEQERSKQAEQHVAELNHYIDELEKSGKALRESHERYRYAAYHDLLTGLANRNGFVEEINRLLSKRECSPLSQFALIYIDLHRFKTVNDSLGHAVGDRLIREVAARLVGLAGGQEKVGRFGGDEFAILLSDVDGPDRVTEFADFVLEAMSLPFFLDRQQIFTGVSMGIVISNSKYCEARDVMRDADIAMYRAKERNRGYVLFEENMHVHALSLLQMETDLRLAVERGEFELFYQPIIDLETMQLSGVEALVRWNHPEFGYVYPEKFIETAEATGLVVPMTLQILESACLELNQWKGMNVVDERFFVSINLSGRHFAHPEVVSHIQEAFAKTGVDPRSIKLEITETAVMENAERASTVLRQIKELGAQLSIDDFGTGYSSLSYLQRFPIDTLKIDRSFVRSMEDGRQNGEIVRMILALSDAMKLSVIAEGVESVHELHQLRIMNCRYGQGYLFSHPLPAHELLNLLKNPNRWENLVSGNSFSLVPPVPILRDLSVSDTVS